MDDAAAAARAEVPGLDLGALRAYLAGSALGLVPGTLLHVTIGATVGAAGETGGPTLLLSLVPLALALAVLVGVHLHRRRRGPAGTTS